MSAFSLAIKSKQQQVHKPVISIQVSQSEEEIVCQFCGKLRRMGRSFLFQGTSECLGLQLLPFTMHFHKALVRHGFNPRLEIYLPPSKLLTGIIEHLDSKWVPTRIEGSSQKFAISLMAPWEGKYIEYSRSQENITIGDVFVSLESPVPLQLFYCWKPTGSSAQGRASSALDESEHKPLFTGRPFKSLFESTESPFSRLEDPSEKESPFPAQRLDDEESLFTTFFRFNNSNK